MNGQTERFAFDLSDLAQWTDRSQRTGRFILTGFLFFTILFLLWTTGTALAGQDHGTSAILWVAISGLFVGLALIGRGFFVQPPREAVLGPDSIEFRFPGDRTLRLRWSNPRLRFRLVTWTAPRRTFDSHGWVVFPYLTDFFPGGLRPSFPITEDLREAIMVEVERHRLEVKSRDSLNHGKTIAVTRLFRARAAASAPA